MLFVYENGAVEEKVVPEINAKSSIAFEIGITANENLYSCQLITSVYVAHYKFEQQSSTIQ